MEKFFTKEVITSLVVLLFGIFLYFLIKYVIRKLFNFRTDRTSKTRLIIFSKENADESQK